MMQYIQITPFIALHIHVNFLLVFNFSASCFLIHSIPSEAQANFAFRLKHNRELLEKEETIPDRVKTEVEKKRKWLDSEFHEKQILFYYFFRQIIPSGLKVDYKILRLVPSFNGFRSRIY